MNGELKTKEIKEKSISLPILIQQQKSIPSEKVRNSRGGKSLPSFFRHTHPSIFSSLSLTFDSLLSHHPSGYCDLTVVVLVYSAASGMAVECSDQWTQMYQMFSQVSILKTQEGQWCMFEIDTGESGKYCKENKSRERIEIMSTFFLSCSPLFYLSFFPSQ